MSTEEDGSPESEDPPPRIRFTSACTSAQRDLAGRDVVAANPVLANRLQQAKRPLHVRAQERPGVGDGAVVVGLGGAVHDGVAPRDKPVEKPGVADVAHDELDPVRGQPGDVLPPQQVGPPLDGPALRMIQNGFVTIRVLYRRTRRLEGQCAQAVARPGSRKSGYRSSCDTHPTKTVPLHGALSRKRPVIDAA